MSKTATQRKPKGATSFSDLHNSGKRIVAVNNGFGSWDGFLFGSFDKLGTECLDLADHLTLADALKRGGADFPVEQWNVQAVQSGSGAIKSTVAALSHSAIVRTDTMQVLGVNGDGYQCLPQDIAFAPAADFDLAVHSDGGPGGNYIGCAVIGNGERIAVLYALPVIDLGKDEEVLPVVLIWTSHDGSKAVEFVFVPLRLACFNGNLWYEQGTDAIVRVKHTKNAELRLEKVTEALTKGNAYLTAYAKEARKLMNARISMVKVDEFLLDLTMPHDKYGKRIEFTDKQVKAATIAEKTRDAIKSAYIHRPDQQNIVGRKWGLLQAVAAYADHEQRTRIVDDGRDPEKKLAELRFLRSVQPNALKDRARALLVA